MDTTSRCSLLDAAGSKRYIRRDGYLYIKIIALLSRVPDIDPFIETRFKERAVQITHDKDCKALLEELEREKSKLNNLGPRSHNRPSMNSRESIRKVPYFFINHHDRKFIILIILM